MVRVFAVWVAFSSPAEVHKGNEVPSHGNFKILCRARALSANAAEATSAAWHFSSLSCARTSPKQVLYTLGAAVGIISYCKLHARIIAGRVPRQPTVRAGTSLTQPRHQYERHYPRIIPMTAFNSRLQWPASRHGRLLKARCLNLWPKKQVARNIQRINKSQSLEHSRHV